MGSLKKNLGYQTIYQILTVGLPLITAPFLSRVLGAEQLGIMSFTTSIANYFVLFAMLGLQNYGTRSIAVVKDDKDMRDQVFSEIFLMQVITSGMAIVCYIIYMAFFCRDNILISWIQFLSVIACLFDISWFFFGIEEFKITVMRNIVIRICSVILMLLLVKKSEDVWIYAVLLIGGSLVSQIVLWFYLPKFLRIRKVALSDAKKHFSPNIKLFIPLLAMSVYHIMDKTMLGAMSNYSESGYYYNADKIINIPIGVLTGIGTVMLPRMSALVGKDDASSFNTLFNTSLKGIGFMSAAMCCGIATIATEFTPFFFGKGYESCITLIVALAPVLFIKGYSLISRNLFLIPNQLEKELTMSVVAGAVTNLIVNLLLIPRFGALGAVIGTLTAELVSCLWQFISVLHRINCVKSLLSGMIYLAFGIVMFFGVRIYASHVELSLILMIISEIAIGALIYVVLCLCYWVVTKNANIDLFLKKKKNL